ncbi:phosphoribosylaminoimidazole-succinocarboxamide synthase, chloroplastic-like [Rutidosis leptorrhynchoides]|uniref:phosphoribosylaminoimidazole-succinocarboxamide synthase, chloroplastic-like n=1 Tax=Rutidosis leptorrhynchoides TaxID=125765 RepID=UPI003A9A63EB
MASYLIFAALADSFVDYSRAYGNAKLDALDHLPPLCLERHKVHNDTSLWWFNQMLLFLLFLKCCHIEKIEVWNYYGNAFSEVAMVKSERLPANRITPTTKATKMVLLLLHMRILILNVMVIF